MTNNSESYQKIRYKAINGILHKFIFFSTNYTVKKAITRI